MNLKRKLKLTKLAMLGSSFICFSVFGASFDCAKASTPHEKLICGTPALSEADSQMGDIYKAVNKSFPISGFIQDSQRDWLVAYRSCKNPAACLDLVNQRIKELSDLKGASVYTDYEGNKFVADGGMIILLEKNPSKTAIFFGNWMPDGKIDPDKMKGYPKDGYICNEEISLVKKGNSYIAKEGSVSEDFSLAVDAEKIVMKGSIMCNARCGFSSGIYKKK